MARVFFCAAPAIIPAALTSLLHPALGALVFVCGFGLGWQVTRARPERGESHD